MHVPERTGPAYTMKPGQEGWWTEGAAERVRRRDGPSVHPLSNALPRHGERLSATRLTLKPYLTTYLHFSGHVGLGAHSPWGGGGSEKVRGPRLRVLPHVATNVITPRLIEVGA